MPQLVQGHARFTAEDFALGDFQTKVTQTYKDNSYLELVEKLDEECSHLGLMRDEEILKVFNTETNIKRSLAAALALITALAQKEGYALNELLRHEA